MKAAISIAAALALAPAAHAQANCAPYQKIAAAIAKNLEPLKGKPVAGRSGDFEPTVSIPDAGECYVSEPRDGRNLGCSREFATEKAARAAASARLAEMKSCLPGWRMVTNNLGPLINDDVRQILAAVDFVEPASKQDARFDLMLNREIDGGKTTYWLNLSAIWYQQ